jgi:acetate kinase
MSPLMRAKMTDGLRALGIGIDAGKNALSQTRNAETDVTAEDSPVKVFVIPTDEELVMVEDTVALIEGRYDVHTRFTYSFQRPDYRNRLREELFQRETASKPDLAGIRALPPV